jgi:hypothetical protein
MIFEIVILMIRSEVKTRRNVADPAPLMHRIQRLLDYVTLKIDFQKSIFSYDNNWPNEAILQLPLPQVKV